MLWKLPVWVGNPAPPLTVTLQSLTMSQNFLNFSAFLYVHVYQSLSRILLFGTLQTVAQQAPLSTDFSRQEYWSGLPFPSSGNLPDPGLEPGSCTLKADSLLSSPLGNASLTTNSGLGQWDNSKWITNKDFENVYHCACLSCCFWNILLPCK